RRLAVPPAPERPFATRRAARRRAIRRGARRRRVNRAARDARRFPPRPRSPMTGSSSMNAPESLGAALRALCTGDDFPSRHIGPNPAQQQAMLATLGYASCAELVQGVLPPEIRLDAPLALDAPRDEASALAELRALAARNELWRSFIGAG